MRRSRSAPGFALAPVRAAISRKLSPLPRLKKKGSLIPVLAAPQARSEFRTAAEAELLDPVVGLLRERECIIEAQRPERGFPNQTHTDRTANVHCIVDGTWHGVGDAGAKGWTEAARNDFARGREGRRPGIIPERTGISVSGDFDARILGQEMKRSLQL